MSIIRNFTLTRIRSAIGRWRSDNRGAVAIIAAFVAIPFSLMLGLVVEEARIYQAIRELNAATQMAALAGAQDINCCTTSKAVATATTYGSLNPIKGQTITMVSGYPKLKCLTTINVSCTGTDSANAIQVSQQVTLPLVFGGFVGKASHTITATATASAKGGGGSKALDVMLVIDTTASMNDADTSCSISGATELTCAEAGAQALLKAFNPNIVDVGLMIFPGVTSTTAQYDYDCATSPTPTTVSYAAASPQYQIIALSNDYKTAANANTSTLNTSSNLVKAVGGGGSGCTQGLDAVGGYGTYYAGVITAAQTALTTGGRTGVQKVMIILSDGNANASSSNVPSGKATNQCHEAITAAQAATTAGIWVYTAAFGSPTGATPTSCTTDTGSGMAISACTTMQTMASTPAMFFADTAGGTSTCTSTVNGSANLATLLAQIGSALTSAEPRLIPNGTT